ncbi:hypothetical protein GCM10010532_089490 [Dactylosporangium siamense]|uniref:Uncharacterized protein n=1 Tax=Dactylosporangium siamense TaxID=685454 RepID=A0A919PWI0_9ACTN|nr:hypothetical protein Dsi01nite_077110 [Dactylosporangium siamense]
MMNAAIDAMRMLRLRRRFARALGAGLLLPGSGGISSGGACSGWPATRAEARTGGGAAPRTDARPVAGSPRGGGTGTPARPTLALPCTESAGTLALP